MRKSLGRVVWMVMIAVVAGCASVPKYRYYTIDMRPGAKLEPAVQIDSVRIDVTQALKRPEILIRTAPTQIDYCALDRWASGLDQQIAEKLLTEVAQAPETAPHLNVDGNLMAFDQVDLPSGAEVHIKLEVHVASLQFQKMYSHTEPASASSAQASVDALSRATEAIAKELAAGLAGVVAARAK